MTIEDLKLVLIVIVLALLWLDWHAARQLKQVRDEIERLKGGRQ